MTDSQDDRGTLTGKMMIFLVILIIDVTTWSCQQFIYIDHK